MNKTRVKPMYGWGWIIDGQPRSEIPQPFNCMLKTCAPMKWTGIVLDAEHEFRGRRVSLSKRHVDWDGYVNILVEPGDEGGKPSSGYGSIPIAVGL